MTAGHQQAAGRLDRALAGLQAGTVGVLNMVLWLGVCSVWRREDFWTGPNLLAGAFCPFALASSRPMTRLRRSLLAMAFALGWYWAIYRWLWRAEPPLAAILHGGRAAVLGHLLYGALLGRFPFYLPATAATEAAPAAAEQGAWVNSGTLPNT